MFIIALFIIGENKKLSKYPETGHSSIYSSIYYWIPILNVKLQINFVIKIFHNVLNKDAMDMILSFINKSKKNLVGP